MTYLRPIAFVLGLSFMAGCQTNDLAEPPAPLGDFALGLNIAVSDKVQMVPISRPATGEEWEAAVIKAVDARFARYEGTKLYNFGISIDAFALAPPGIPLVLSPKSALVMTVTVWDDAAQKKLNPEGKQFTIFEKMSGETMIGSGLTQNKRKQMDVLSYNAAKAIEGWLLENPEWFGLPPLPKAKTGPVPTVVSTPVPATPKPVAEPVAAADVVTE
jgi:hypothetical protein